MIKTAKPFKQAPRDSQYCLNFRIENGDNLSSAWHCHPEIELALVKGSKGTRIIGSSVENFDDSDLVLIGKNLPHAFLHVERSADAQDVIPEVIVIHFHENFLGNDFLNLPQFGDIRHILSKARQGLFVTGWGKEQIIPLMEKSVNASSLDRLILLLEILKVFTDSRAYRVLVNDDLHTGERENDKRFNSILEFTYSNYDEHIHIDDVAKIANLTKESFCRYFKSQANKTYMEFLTEYRINRACQMIKDSDRSIKEVGYSCGFDSLSNFYYQFKKIKKLSPLEFKCSGLVRSQEC